MRGAGCLPFLFLSLLQITPMKNLAYLTLIGLIITSCSKGTSSGDTFEDSLSSESEFIEYNNPPAEGFNLEDSDMLAMLLADKSMQAMGGREAWDNTRYLSWNFFGRRTHVWDKSTGNLRIEVPSSDLFILMNINDKQGRVQKSGVEVTDSLDYFLQKGYEWWINDSYWLVMPYKLKDSGVTLKYIGEDTTQEGRLSDVLQLSFKDVGVTPANIYEVWIDAETKLVSQWAYYPDSNAREPRFNTPWKDYSKYGEVLLSGDRGDYQLTDIKVFDQLDPAVFTSFQVEIP